MKKPDFEQLEKVIHQELARLPERQAPAELIPGVFARIKSRAAKPWWQRPFSSWPAWSRFSGLVLMAILPSLLTYALMSWWPAATAATVGLKPIANSLNAAIHLCASLLDVLYALVRSLGPLGVAGIGVALGALCAGWLGLGTLFARFLAYNCGEETVSTK
jgi:hypothetical protein